MLAQRMWLPSIEHHKKVPYVPSSWEQVWTMVELAEVQKGGKVADLGCGDGRIVRTFAKLGAQAHGYEIDPNLVFKAEDKILQEKLDGNAFIHWKDYWEENLSPYNIIIIFGLTSIMGKLEEKLEKELRFGTRVISNIFTFPTWKPKKVQDNVYLYIV